MNAQTFHPAIGPENGVTVEGSRTPGVLTPMANLLFEFAYRPLRLADSQGAAPGDPVATMSTLHVMGGLGLTRWLAISLDLPVVLYQSASGSLPAAVASGPPGAVGMGDVRLVMKARLVDNSEGGFGLALVPQFTFPSGGGVDFRGYSLGGKDVYTIEPRLALDYRTRRGLFVALNLGFQGRVCSGVGGSFDPAPGHASHACDQTVLNDRVSHLFTYGLGVYAPLGRGFGLSGELVGAASVARTDAGGSHAPLAGYLGARWAHAGGLTVSLGAGGTFLPAAGEPPFRIFAGLGYLPFRGRYPGRVRNTVP